MEALAAALTSLAPLAGAAAAGYVLRRTGVLTYLDGTVSSRERAGLGGAAGVLARR